MIALYEDEELHVISHLQWPKIPLVSCASFVDFSLFPLVSIGLKPVATLPASDWMSPICALSEN